MDLMALAFIFAAVLLVLIVVGIAGLVVVRRRERKTAAATRDLLRAGTSEGQPDQRAAYASAQGKQAWTRISGGA